MKNFKFKWLLLSIILSIASINTMWAWNLTKGRTIYFDKQNCTDFGNPWFRLGNNNASMAGTMTLVAGTKYLYSYTAGSNWDNYGAFSVADDDGWTGSNSIYQNGNGITKQTDYQKYDLSSDCYLKITSSSNKDGDCQYYHVNNITSGDGELASLPTYSVTYDTPTNGTLTVQKYTGSTYTALSSGTTGLKPTQIIKITTSPNTHYGLKTLTVTGAVQIDGGNTYYITGNCTISATFDLKWNVKGGDSDAANGSDAMGDWATYIKLSYTGTANTYSGTVYNLLANTTYRFKVVELNGSGSGANDVYYGYGTNDGNNDVLSFVGQTTGSAVYTGNQHNLVLKTASAGTYTFTWNSSTNTISVGFPTVTHPSGDYIYFKNTKGWSYITAHIFNGTPISTGWQNLPVLSSFNFDGTNYYYAASGGNTNILASEGTTDTNTKKTADLTVSKGKGKYYDIIDKSENSGNEDATKWKNFTATLTLDHQSPSNTPAPNTITVTYGASTNLTGDVITTSPAKGGYYTFGGYYTEEGGAGDQFIAAGETVNTNVPDYTDGSKNWIKTGSVVSKTIYAKWTQTVTLHDNNGGVSNGSTTATWNAAGPFSITTAPTKTGYTVEGYYAEVGCTNKVLTAAGAIAGTNVSDGSSVVFISGSKWKHEAATTLYTKWNEIKHTVSVAAGANGSISGSVSSVTNVGIATASSKVTAVADDGYDFNGWTLPTGVTAAEGYTAASNPISINATEDGKTITANFTAHTYIISLEAGDHGAADGSATVVFNTSSLATVSHVSANPGYQLGGYYDGELKVLNADGSFAGENISGYITSGKWSKYADAELTAKFSPVTLYFRANSTSYWNTAANWYPACVPTIYHDVFIEKPVEVDIAHAVAKSVVIDTSSTNTGKLTVQADKGLEVTGTIKLKNSSGSLVATSSNNIVLESSASGNATLIFDNSTMKDSATVCLYSKGYTDGTQGGGTWVWQYVGVPVTNATRLSDYYGGYMYEWTGGAWVDKKSDETLTPFTAYSVSYKTTSDKLHTYVIDGELAQTGDMSIDIPAGTNFMFVANSWTAPIYIQNVEFTNARATVYFLNSGQGKPTRTTTSKRFAAGTYLPIPVNSSPYTEDSLIAPMQAFMVRNLSGSDGSMNIDYGTVVRPARTDQNINAGQMHAPQRLTEEMPRPVVLKMYVDGVEYGDRVILLEREDFTRGFDNGWDGEKLQVNAATEAPRMFAINETGGKEAISAIPELNGTVIGFRPGTDATYTISFEYNGSEPLYLRDTRTNQMANIDNMSEYMFSSDGTNEDSRFIIVKSPAITTGISETGVDAIARKQIIDGVLYIIRNGQMFTAEGQMVK